MSVSAVATDALGKLSPARSATINVDRTGPQLSLTGELRDAAGEYVGDDPLAVQASARDLAGSGVTSLELLVDGERRDRREQPCQPGGCSMEREFSVDPATLAEGAHEISVRGEDAAGNAVLESWTVKVDRTPPGLTLSGALWDSRGDWLGADTLQLDIEAQDAGAGAVSAELVIDGVSREIEERACPDGGCDLSASWDVDLENLEEGRHLVQVLVLDTAGRLSQESWTAKIDRNAPNVDLDGPLADAQGAELTAGSHDLEVAATDEGAGLGTLEILLDGERKTFVEQPCAEGGCGLDRSWTLDSAGLESGPHTVEVVARDLAGRDRSRTIEFTVAGASGEEAPPAPELTDTTTTPFDEATKFLYTGANPVQTGVAEDAIDRERAAVIRGKVTARGGAPLPGVTVTVAREAEFGSTKTRADGEFYLATNGGGTVTVRYEKQGYLSADRQVQVPWQDYAWAEDVALVPLDGRANQIDLSDTLSEPQVARGSAVQDADGPRQATLLFQPGTQASMTLPDGTSQPLENLTVRATEYTVGPGGREAMPGELPPSSAYTYAAEFSVDEAQAASATDVRFDRPVASYTDNFLEFPVGTQVPAAYYDSEKSAWVPEDDGRVVKVLAEDAGKAQIDVSGDGAGATAEQLTALGVTDTELAQLAELYEPGKSLWRVQLRHFSPWDYNWPWGFPEDVIGPEVSAPEGFVEGGCEQAGSVIGCENQTLGEDLPVSGTDLSLHYRSDRMPGYKSDRTLPLRLTPAEIPSSLRAVRLEIEIAGRRIERTFEPEPNLAYKFEWDGRDAYGRLVEGGATARVNINFDYRLVQYRRPEGSPRSFGLASRVVVLTDSSTTRADGAASQTLEVPLGGLGPSSSDAGGWTIGSHHRYDPAARKLYTGSGERRSAARLASVFSVVAGNRDQSSDNVGDGGPATAATLVRPTDVAVGADGAVFFPDDIMNRVRRVDRAGTISTVAGTGRFREEGAPLGDGGPATNADLRGPTAVAVGSDGALYIGDGNLVRRVSPEGTIKTVAGSGSYDFSGDGGPATEAGMGPVTGLAITTDGALYMADGWYSRVRRVAPDGTINTVAGNGEYGSDGDGGPAVAASLESPSGVAVKDDGTVYVSDERGRVRRIRPDGIIDTVAGGGDQQPQETPLATQASLYGLTDVDLGSDGSVYITDNGDGRIYRIDEHGRLQTVAGGEAEYASNGQFATEGDFRGLIAAAVGKRGDVYAIDDHLDLLVRAAPALPGSSVGDAAVPSKGGRSLFHFDPTGRHLRTERTDTGAVVERFGYDTRGRLTTIDDGDGDRTTIERDADGTALAIVGPDGHRTVLGTGDEGYLESITNPAGDTNGISYTPEGLLKTFTTPEGNTNSYDYDPDGRLIRARDAAGGEKTLSRTELSKGHEVEITTKLGRTDRYRVRRLSDEDTLREHVDPAGHTTSVRSSKSERVERTAPDGTTTTSEPASDPRYGAAAAYAGARSVTTPDERVLSVKQKRSVEAEGETRLLIDEMGVNLRKWRTTFDQTARLAETTSPTGRKQSTTVDEQGRPLRSEVPGLDPVVSSYDERGRMTATEQAGRSLAFDYDERGRLESATDALDRSTSFVYDDADRVTAQTQPDGRVVRFGYDRNGNVTSVTPPSRPAHAFTHTALDQPLTYVPPDTGVSAQPTTYAYNADRQLTRVERPGGQAIAMTYDDAGRPQSVTGGDHSVALSYDAETGMPRTATTDDGEAIEYRFDGGLPVGELVTGIAGGEVSRAFDDDLRVASESAAGSEVGFSYDPDSLLTGVGDLSLERNPDNGLLTATTLGSLRTTVTSNGVGEPEQVSTTGPVGDLFEETYARDAVGRISMKTVRRGQASTVLRYRYDQAGRLDQVTRDGVVSATYHYDPNGNRVGVDRAQGGSVSAEYDAQDRLSRYGDATYEYTPAGDLRSKTDGGDTTSYSYDAFGALRGVTAANGTEISYVVDPAGRRVAKRRDGEVVQRLLYGSGPAPLAQLDADGDPVARFVYGTRSNVPDYMVRGGRTFRVLTDQLGSPRVVADASTGEVVQEIDYDEFGGVLSDTNPGFQPFGYAGGLYDSDTGLVRFGARDYDPETGRWTAKDPIGFAGGDTNLYGYVLGDPINWTDPTGLLFGIDLPDIDLPDPPSLDDVFGVGGVIDDMAPDFVSNALAGGFDSATGGLASEAFGVDSWCGATGYGFGRTLVDLTPRGVVNKAGSRILRFAQRGKGKRTHTHLEGKSNEELKEMLGESSLSAAERRKVREHLKAKGEIPSRQTKDR